MSDLNKYIEKRKSTDPEFADGFDLGYAAFKTAFRAVMETQHHHRMTTNILTGGDGIQFDRKEIYVPLGLVERHYRPKRYSQEGLPEEGSEIYQEKITAIDIDTFFEQLLGSPNDHKRLAIIGEPGAGKTTLLQKIAEEILLKTDDIPIWISLGALGKKTLRDYLLEDWLRDAAQELNSPPSAYQESFSQLLKAGKVWLLLDGVDEMGVDNPLYNLSLQFGEGWARNVKVVLTCCLNIWEANKNELYRFNFEVYRNLDFTGEPISQLI